MKILFLSILFFMPNINNKIQAQNTPNAKVILESVREKYKKFNTIKADFKLIGEIPDHKYQEVTLAGTLYLKKTKFRIESVDKFLICNGHTTWLQIKNDSEVIENAYDPKDWEPNHIEVFAIYEKGYLYSYSREDTIDNKIVQVIDLKPKDKHKDFIKIELYIN